MKEKTPKDLEDMKLGCYHQGIERKLADTTKTIIDFLETQITLPPGIRQKSNEELNAFFLQHRTVLEDAAYEEFIEYRTIYEQTRKEIGNRIADTLQDDHLR
jgi:hypothetical protein